MAIGVKVFDTLRMQLGEDKCICEAQDVQDLLAELGKRLELEQVPSLREFCIFKENVNVELIGGEVAPLFENDWVAVFPRHKDAPPQEIPTEE